jgi:bacterioferritin-associated ferredoxin
MNSPQPDDDLCQCFHVSARKVIRFIEQNRPQVPSQVSECYGAGTGCGWCRGSLRKLVTAAQAMRAQGAAKLDPEQLLAMLPSAAESMDLRQEYLADRSGGEAAEGGSDSAGLSQ